MQMEFNNYHEINDFRLKGIALSSQSNEDLNEFHDLIYHHVLSMSVNQIKLRYGQAPSPFTFFVMGSAGRMEQSIWSDQDHGVIYQMKNEESKEYFIRLGEEISKGLMLAGYTKCPGGVMASNPMWSKSADDWRLQINHWACDSSWEAIRYLLIFADARPFHGDPLLLSNLKKELFTIIDKKHLIIKLLHNTMHLKKGVGILGQLLVETHGTFSGSINLKNTAFFPYVNAVRLLALSEWIPETSTLARIQLIPENIISFEDKASYSRNFSNLLNFRLKHGIHSDYASGHYVNGAQLTKLEKKELKDILKAGERLFIKARKLIEKGVKYGNE